MSELEKRIIVAPKPLNFRRIMTIIGGSALYAASVNIFMMPLHLYVGGVVGLSQLLASVFLPGFIKFNISGLINFMLNVPLFILGYKTMSKNMMIGTLCSILIQTLCFSLIPIPAIPLLDDKLSCILVAGLLGGIGCGGMLIGGGSGGGLDLLGVYLTEKRQRFSVGRMNLYFNIVFYTICALLFDVQTALYSIIYIAVFSFTLDRWHYQNIEMQLMIFTHEPKVKQMILDKYVRGVTYWDGKGAYTNKETEVLVTIVSKSEVASVKSDILSLDPKAFIIVIEGTKVTGGYEKRLA